MQRPLRSLLPALLSAVLLGLGSVAPAAADDELPPPVYPSGLPRPGDIGNPVPSGGYTPGPTIVITPGSTGTALPQPTAGGSATPGASASSATSATPGTTPGTTPSEGSDGLVAGESGTPAAAVPATGGSPLWLAVAAGLVVALGLLATFGGALRRRVTRDPESR